MSGEYSYLGAYMHPCEACNGTGTEDFEWGKRYCSRCEGTGIEPEPEPELTKDEILAALREAWDDVVHHRTHILHDFTDFFKDELGEE